MNILDELMVPAPPYRMKRPLAVPEPPRPSAVLAFVGPTGEKPEVQAPPWVPPVEAAPPLPELKPPSPAEKMAERWAAMKARTQTTRAEIEHTPPPVDATPQESQQFVEVQQGFLGKVEEAAKFLLEMQAKFEVKPVNESAIEKVGRLSRDALTVLNTYRELQDKNASKKELEAAGQQVRIAQRDLGVTIGAGVKEQGQDVTSAPTPEPVPQKAADAASVADATESKADQGDGGNTEAPAEKPQSGDAALEVQVNEAEQAMREASAAGDAEALKVAGRKFIKGRNARVRLRRKNEDAEANAADAIAPQPSASEGTRTQDNRPVASAAENVPTPEQQRIAQLEEKIGRLEAQISAGQGGGGEEQPPGDGGGGEPPPEGLPAPQEGPLQIPPGTRIRDIGEQEGASAWKKGVSRWEIFQTYREAKYQGEVAAISFLLAKKWKGRLERRDEKIKKWEASARESTKKGMLGALKSVFWDEQWAKHHRRLGRRAYKKQERWNDSRVLRENARNEILNQGAAKIDRLLDSQYERIDQYAYQRDEIEAMAESLEAKHQGLRKLLTRAVSAADRSLIGDELDKVAKQMKVTAEKWGVTDTQWKAERKKAGIQQARKEGLMQMTIHPTREDTTPKKEYPWLVQRQIRAGGSPKARAGSTQKHGLRP